MYTVIHGCKCKGIRCEGHNCMYWLRSSCATWLTVASLTSGEFVSYLNIDPIPMCPALGMTGQQGHSRFGTIGLGQPSLLCIRLRLSFSVSFCFPRRFHLDDDYNALGRLVVFLIVFYPFVCIFFAVYIAVLWYPSFCIFPSFQAIGDLFPSLSISSTDQFE